MTMLPFAGAVVGIVFVGLILAFALIMVGSRGAGSSLPRPVRHRSADWFQYGATLIDDGYDFYPDWCSSMLREFDDSIEPQLQSIYDAAKEIAQHPRDQWPPLIARHAKMHDADLASR